MQLTFGKDICLTKKEVLYLKDKIRWLDRLGESLDLPGEHPPGQPIVEIAGDRRVLIEGHRGVVQYDKCLIRIRLAYGAVQIQGRELELAHMTKESLVIFGRIESVTLCRRE